jgi:hypothetical protein
MGESYGLYRREVDCKGLDGCHHHDLPHDPEYRRHKLASLSTTLTLNMQL